MITKKVSEFINISLVHDRDLPILILVEILKKFEIMDRSPSHYNRLVNCHWDLENDLDDLKTESNTD